MISTSMTWKMQAQHGQTGSEFVHYSWWSDFIGSSAFGSTAGENPFEREVPWFSLWPAGGPGWTWRWKDYRPFPRWIWHWEFQPFIFIHRTRGLEAKKQLPSRFLPLHLSESNLTFSRPRYRSIVSLTRSPRSVSRHSTSGLRVFFFDILMAFPADCHGHPLAMAGLRSLVASGKFVRCQL